MNDNVCPCCENTSFSDFRMSLLQCESCGLVVDCAVWKQSANETMEEEWFGEGYDPQISPWVRLFEYWNNRRTYRRIASVKLPGSRLLEIGVGSGSFLQFARSRGFEVFGCDLSKAICRLVQHKYGISTYNGHVAALPDHIQFDAVVMNHVLEHVSDPIGMLREIRRRIKPGGILHLAVPNVDSWEARLPGWTSYEPYHLLYFSPATLKRAVEQVGFKIQCISTHESFSGWFLAILRTLLKTSQAKAAERRASRKLRVASGLEHIYRLAMIASGTLIWPLRVLQSALGKGDEVILIAQVYDGK